MDHKVSDVDNVIIRILVVGVSKKSDGDILESKKELS